MKIVLFDQHRQALLPFSYTRPVGEIRVGIDTISKKWERLTGAVPGCITHSTLSAKFEACDSDEIVAVRANLLPDKELLVAIENLNDDQQLHCNGLLAAVRLKNEEIDALREKIGKAEKLVEWPGRKPVYHEYNTLEITRPYQIFKLNGEAIKRDIRQITKGYRTLDPDPSNKIMGDELYIEEGAKVRHAIINTETGPVYIARGAEVMEGSIIRGPFAMCENSVLKLGAKVYGPTTLGPYCKVGGEVNNSVLFGYSNKGHDGFLGNSVIGEWCNIGADTNTSNLKNNYGEIKVWDYHSDEMKNTGLQFHGLLMGDHSKCGINTMFNTGTTVGVAANIFGADFPPKFIPSFSWGGSGGLEENQLEKVFEAAERMMERRDVPLSEKDRQILQSVFESSAKYRKQAF